MGTVTRLSPCLVVGCSEVVAVCRLFLPLARPWVDSCRPSLALATFARAVLKPQQQWLPHLGKAHLPPAATSKVRESMMVYVRIGHASVGELVHGNNFLFFPAFF